jgi:uncharacterized membrane protein SpoIIM required for sporulation
MTVPFEERLQSARFRREREASWRELERLVERMEKGGVSALTASELYRLPALYRGAVSSLAVARAISLDRNLLEYLTALAGRAYLCVYSTKRRAGQAVREFLVRGFPAAVRRRGALVAVAVGLLLGGILTGYRLTQADGERFYSFVGEDLAQGRTPAATTAELRAPLYDRQGGWSSLLAVFASFLFTHNARVAILSFGLGFAAGLPAVFLLFANGLALGAMAALYQAHGLGFEFWGWVLPHGITELGAVCLCGAAGLALGTALVFPGRHGRLARLAAAGREVAPLVVGAVGMLLLAGLVEGAFRQLVQDLAARWLVAGGSLVVWLAYFFYSGARDDSEGAGGVEQGAHGDKAEVVG